MLLKEKYLKYKIKYLKLKKNYLNIKGGNKPFLKNDNNINLFNPEIPSHILMESYLNPIYGLYMCESGFITNNYYLYDCFNKTILDKAKYAKRIHDLSRIVTRTVQPTNDIITKIKSIDIGRYIAILFFYKFYPNYITFTKKQDKEAIISFTSTRLHKKYNKDLIKFNIDKLNEYLSPISIIKIKSDINDIIDIDFHIILYCLWWILNNNEGIQSYYQGINEVINICNILFNQENILQEQNKLIEPIELIDMRYENNDSNSFEKTVLDITKKDFHVYTQEQALHFCPIVLEEKALKDLTDLKKNNLKEYYKKKEKDLKYPDCGEVTARNLINLICFDPSSGLFNCEILVKYGAIIELIEYYEVFNTFEKQSTTKKFNIYDQELNARDAWSKLLIFYANHNLVFTKSCKTQPSSKYELNSGMSEDNKTTNFFQLIKNLLPEINKWKDLNVDETFEIISNDTEENGIGKIVIKANNYEDITIHCEERHYYMIIDKKPSSDYDIEKLKDSQKLKINILLNDDITMGSVNNYLWINWSSELLVDKINNESIDFELRKKLLELSFTDKFDSDTRSQIVINTSDDTEFFEYFIAISNMNGKINEKINEYTYESTDFNFVKKLANLIHLNSKITNNNLKTIDLTPLENIRSIGNNFMYFCTELETINLEPLSNVKSIGNNFMSYCESLENIDLTCLSKVTSIGNDFLFYCGTLTTIDLKPLSDVTSIGNNFMNYCDSLKNIDLTCLSKVTSIGNDFMRGCRKLESINLSSLTKIISIGNYFMVGCYKLESINLSSLSKVTSIGDYFMESCTKLSDINLSSLSKVTSIGDYFMRDCIKLEKIDLTPLSKLTSIGTNFMVNCEQLEKIDLPHVSKITSIGDFFMNNCSKLNNIDLTIEIKIVLQINNESFLSLFMINDIDKLFKINKIVNLKKKF